MALTISNPTDEPRGDFLLYDNECPFCSAYVRMVRLREAGVELQLIDGREAPHLVRKYAERGMNINDGMILRFGGDVHFGADAINRLALMSTTHGSFNAINRLVFSSPLASKLLYPVLRMGRNVTLRLLGRNPIDLAS